MVTHPTARISTCNSARRYPRVVSAQMIAIKRGRDLEKVRPRPGSCEGPDQPILPASYCNGFSSPLRPTTRADPFTRRSAPRVSTTSRECVLTNS